MFKILLIGYFCKFTIARREYKYIFFSSSGFCKAYNKASCTVECTVTWKLKFDMCKLQKIFSRNFRHFTWKWLQHGADFSECLWKASSESKISQNLLDLKLLSIKENKLKLKGRKLNKNVSGKSPLSQPTYIRKLSILCILKLSRQQQKFKVKCPNLHKI